MHQPYPGPPPKKGGALKWILGGIALLAIIAITAVVSISLSSRGGHDSEGAGENTASGSEFASANDTRPITIITEDPSCAPWTPILNTLADTEKNGWDKRDASIPASAWSPEQRTQHEQVGQAMSAAADQTEPLVKLTTNRVVRQLYEQFIAYARAYAKAIPNYTNVDDQLARTANSATAVLAGICQAIKVGSAPARATMVAAGPTPTTIAPLGNPAKPARFLTGSPNACEEWKAATDEYSNNTTDWAKTDPNVTAGQWTPEDKALNDAVIPVMRDVADKFEKIGQRSSNPTFEDFATLAAQYRRAYAQAIPTHSPTDEHLYTASTKVSGMILAACAAPEPS
ncbi:hypothetical protein FR943_03615 [Mycobacterium sp. TNTM28]|uniref:Uncharacterized protein n=1 Tax=[Mycobacterium] fortunisiensis TaxID=2600579 RepID=A0ABS6KHB0_9MYCO|nr:hypothetical protein [[Mycobacterium] fortunisiensis]MBU9762940.1 hypothetical protein [[Mycobacterium] fortunisiensis]